MPPIRTCVPPSVVGRGRVAACAADVARLKPKTETSVPGASGVCPKKLAEFRMPPAFRIGGSALAAICPPTCAVPDMAGADVCAVRVMTAFAAAVRGCHVPDHVPLPSAASASGGSPLENVATICPFVMKFPQLSTS